MINFSFEKGHIEVAMFGGGVTEMLTDLAFEISLMYGGLKVNARENVADEFKNVFLTALTDKNFVNDIFSTQIYDNIVKSEDYTAGSISLGDKDELMRQLKEVLGGI